MTFSHAASLFSLSPHALTNRELTELSADQKLGQAKVSASVDVLTGELWVKDHVLHFPDVGGAVEFAYVYQRGRWQLCAGLQLEILEDKQRIGVLGADGKYLTALWNEVSQRYEVADGVGMYQIYFDAEIDQYICYHTGSRLTTYLRKNGSIAKQKNALGHFTEFEFEGDALNIIKAPSGACYKFVREMSNLKVYRVKDGVEALVHIYELNGDNLIASKTQDGYITDYLYRINQSLESIFQTDKTKFKFCYKDDSVVGVEVGDDDPAIWIIESNGDSKNVILASGDNVAIRLDKNQQTINIDQNQKNMNYHINLAGLIDGVTYPDGSLEKFVYDSKTGLILAHFKRDGGVISYEYSDDDKPVLLSEKLIFEGNIIDSKQYIYTIDHATNIKYLSYEISLGGAVCKYERNALNQVSSIYRFTKPRSNSEDPTLDNMKSWCEEMSSYGEITDLSYRHGQLDTQKQYSSPSKDVFIEKKFDRDARGNLLNSKTLVCPVNEFYLEARQQVDQLNRLKKHVFGCKTGDKQTTSIEYQTNLIKKIVNNGRVTNSTLNTRGEITEEIQHGTAEDIHRTQIQCFDKHHLTVITHPDDSEHYEYKDDQNRTVYEVGPLGECVKHEYNETGRFCIQTMYANAIDINVDKAKQGIMLPKLSGDDRVTTSFFGLNEKLRYLVDALGYVTEYRYNGRGQQTHVIRYLEAVTDQELVLLKSGKDWKRQPDRDVDRVESTFYDADGYVVAEQDAAGYVTKFINDALGRECQKLVYFKPDNSFTDNLQTLILDENDARNAVSIRSYNGLDQCHQEINAEGCAITRSYTTDGKLDWERKHFIPMYGRKPVYDGRDQIDHYFYDDLRRLIKIQKSTGEVIEYSHDEMDQPVSVIHRDSKYPHRKDGDHYRAEFKRYDKWEQCIASINPFVAMRLAECVTDADRDALWKKHSEHFEYNATGLKTKSSDAMGNVTLHYYDKSGHEVLRIDPTGAAISWTYNNFGELTHEHQYYNRIPQELLNTFHGGRLTPEVSASLKEDESNDKYLERKFDLRGQVYQVIENKKRVTEHKYNAFKQVEKTILPPVQGISATLKYKHEQRGKVKEVERSAPNCATQITKSEYENPLAIKSAEENAVGGRTEWQHNKLGQVIGRRLRNEDGWMEQFEKIERDAFGRIFKITDSDSRVINIEYSLDGLTETWHYPDLSSKEFIHNIFGDVIVAKIISPSGELLSQLKFEHAPDGQLESKADRLGDTLRHKFNVLGLCESTTFPNNFIYKYHYNAAHVCDLETHQGVNKSTSLAFGIDAFGRRDTILDALNHIKSNEYDAFDNVRRQSQLMDANGYSLEKVATVDSSGYVNGSVQGDSDNLSQQTIAEQRDAYNRITATVVDPKGLKLTHANQYDGLNRAIREVDPEGYVKQSWHNVKNDLRFQLIPLTRTHSQLLEFKYTPSGKLIERRLHRFPVCVSDIKETTTLEELKKLYPGKDCDQVTRYILDANGNPQFKIKLVYDGDDYYKAIISEKRVNAAGHVTFVSRYAMMPMLKSPEEISYQYLEKLVLNPALRLHHQNKATHYFYNEALQKDLIVDQSGYLVQHIHDAKGRVTEKRYYNQRVDGFDSKRPLIPENATYRKQCFIFDDFGNEIAQVKADGTVIKKEYDDNNNHVKTCLFHFKINSSMEYTAICKKVASMVPNAELDSITGSEFDNADRLVTAIDGRQCKDLYKLNAFGNIEEHTNRNGHTTTSNYDKAQRKISETSPETNFARVTLGVDGKLRHDNDRKRIVKQFHVDGNGNVLGITDGVGLSDQRHVGFDYAAKGELTGSEVKEVVIDGSKEKVSVITKVILDAQGRKIAECDEGGFWNYYVRDALGNVIYKILKQTSVEYYEYNAIGKESIIKKFATPFVCDDQSIFTDPAKIIKAMEWMQTYSDSPDDRMQTLFYNPEGHLIRVVGRPTPCFDRGKLSVTNPVTETEYNIHQEVIYERKLIGPDHWAESAIWRDECGREILIIDENGFATAKDYNSFGLETVKVEYSEVQSWASNLRELSHEPVDKIMDILKHNSNLDRLFVKEYDQRGDVIEEKILDVKAYALEFTGAMVPKLVDTMHRSSGKKYKHNTYPIQYHHSVQG